MILSQFQSPGARSTQKQFQGPEFQAMTLSKPKKAQLEQHHILSIMEKLANEPEMAKNVLSVLQPVPQIAP